jgi:hypothetical protein
VCVVLCVVLCCVLCVVLCVVCRVLCFVFCVLCFVCVCVCVCVWREISNGAIIKCYYKLCVKVASKSNIQYKTVSIVTFIHVTVCVYVYIY